MSLIRYLRWLLLKELHLPFASTHSETEDNIIINNYTYSKENLVVYILVSVVRMYAFQETVEFVLVTPVWTD